MMEYERLDLLHGKRRSKFSKRAEEIVFVRMFWTK